MSVQDSQLFINGKWCDGASGITLPVVNPATGRLIGRVSCADTADLARAVYAADSGFQQWRKVNALERCTIMRRAASLIREQRRAIAEVLTAEQGKPIAESLTEISTSADHLEWLAEEGRRSYGRVVPSRHGDVRQMVVKEPVGPVAALSPWNFPVSQMIRKVAGALAAGCSVVAKPAEEAPGAPALVIRAFEEAGVPAGVIGLVFGEPAMISDYLISHPAIRKLSFTGSTEVGRQLSATAGRYLKRSTMELGGHAPAIVMDDADIELAALLLARAKFRNAGQVCVAPSRFLVQENVYGAFVAAFTRHTNELVVGNGADPATTMGPLANERRVLAQVRLVENAIAHGASVVTGGSRLQSTDNEGFFFAPTVLVNVPHTAALMNEEPFGPIAPIVKFNTVEAAIAEANRLPYGLSAYVYTTSSATAHRLSECIEAGTVSINHHGTGLPEVPLGGVKDSGYGVEGGAEALDAFMVTKLITQMN
jgi:succinate-semialdehyde dehydrogenase/glutarate-semialdehyde dehydrogenase